MGRFRGFNTYMEYERGFRGWLAFFFITSCVGVLQRCYTLFRMGAVLEHAFALGAPALAVCAVVVAVLIIAALLIGSIYGLRLFVNEDRRTPAFWTRYLIVQLVADVLYFACLAFYRSMASDEGYMGVFAEYFTSGFLFGFLVMACWAAYWMRSKRVRATYGYSGFGPAQSPAVNERAA